MAARLFWIDMECVALLISANYFTCCAESGTMRPVQVALSILGGSIVVVQGFFSTPTVWRPGLVSHILVSPKSRYHSFPAVQLQV